MAASAIVLPGIRDELPTYLRSGFPDAQHVGVVVDEHVLGLWPLEELEDGWEEQAFELTVCPVPRGEAAKTRDVLAMLQDRLVHLRRDEPVVVIGGGSTTDVGGFAAATLRRGLPWIAVPTTVIGMADAAVGGKVGVNHPRGKNLLGSFHLPALVLVDPDYLATLDERDRVSGTAELAKCARLGDARLFEALSTGPARDSDRSVEDWAFWITRAVEVKERFVAEDPKDVGPRRLLNYGHTVGHALETLLGNERMRHGEAVAIGMQVAMAIAVARDVVDTGAGTEQTRLLKRLGLPVAIPSDVTSVDALMDTLGLDKKRKAGDRHTFVLPTGAIGAVVAEDVTDAEVRRALDAVR